MALFASASRGSESSGFTVAMSKVGPLATAGGTRASSLGNKVAAGAAAPAVGIGGGIGAGSAQAASATPKKILEIASRPAAPSLPTEDDVARRMLGAKAGR